MHTNVQWRRGGWRQCLTLLELRWIYSLKSVSDLNWKNIAEPKTENSFWPANFVFVQLRHFFGLKISQFWNFQSLLDEFGNYFSDSKYVLTLSMLHTMSMNVFLNKKEEKRNPKCDVVLYRKQKPVYSSPLSGNMLNLVWCSSSFEVW